MNTNCNTNIVSVDRTTFNLRYIELDTPEAISAAHEVFNKLNVIEEEKGILSFIPMTTQQHKIIFGES